MGKQYFDPIKVSGCPAHLSHCPTGATRNTIYRLLLALLFLLPGLTRADTLLQDLTRLAPTAQREVIRLAVDALSCATASGMESPQRLAVIDYSLPSVQPRLWVFDLQQRRLLLNELVAHGRNSGENYASSFSNTYGSYQSSLGLFRTLNSYQGKHGYSLRMEGVEPGVNDKAFERAIVIHGAPYVDPKLISKQGRIGRSLGCPAVRPQVARELINHLKEGQFLFAYYPDPEWLKSSAFLKCPATQGNLITAQVSLD